MGEPPDEWKHALDWIKRHSLPVSELLEPDTVRRALEALSRKIDGKPAAAKTAVRKRSAFSEVLGTAVDKGYFTENPLARVKWNPPAVAPAEVIHLQLSQCHLPTSGWGMLNLTGGIVAAGKGWTDDGSVHEVHSLKRRALKATRPVPIPPSFVAVLREHIDRFGVAPDGRLFRNAAGNYVEAGAYGITWARARRKALADHEQSSSLAKRPYDLRHAGISFWLYSGVDPAECARRAGQSIQVRRLRTDPGSGPCMARNSWSGVGNGWEELGLVIEEGACRAKAQVRRLLLWA
ncbi:integrase [Streptomyces sp. NBC_00536]|uniref:hypothetical protein n=1 Tax=Streptomyces sp. NBC_00536 TaxID=2975769 RepID=UPI002E807079|nr:hypothetical protein [Streptomyces sp. NBC_00536]WUC77685.1 integrase [Streptomyces sp. NBC_00536]